MKMPTSRELVPYMCPVQIAALELQQTTERRPVAPCHSGQARD